MLDCLWQSLVGQSGRALPISRRLAIDPERVPISRQLLDCVRNALQDIPQKSRDIFILFRLYDRRQKQLAKDFGISVSSVAKHIVKASVILAFALTDRDPTDLSQQHL